MMQRDLRQSSLFKDAEALYESLRRPRTGQISDATELHVSPDGERVVFAGAIVDKLEGTPPTRICVTELSSGDTRVLTFGPNVDRSPKFSPDGRRIAFLSDRERAGDFQLYLLDARSGAARAAPPVEGWIEYLHWSPDGERILLGVAGHGADVAGGQGAVTSKRLPEGLPSWMPSVETKAQHHQWRTLWLYDFRSNQVRAVDLPGRNVWEAHWCGNHALAAVVSAGAQEGLWYNAHLEIVSLSSGESREVYKPRDQLGWPSASPSGRHLAVVDALCSDRWIVAGDLQLIDTSSGRVQQIDTRSVDVSYTEWRSDRRLLVAGHRRFETVIGVYDLDSNRFSEVWSSTELTTGGFYVTVSGFGDRGDCALVGEGFMRAPEIATIRNGDYQAVLSLDIGEYANQANAIDAVETITWKAPDGLDIDGWVLRPKADGPRPLVMNVHGGPVWQWRPVWLGRGRAPSMLMLLRRGYAVFLPNPRGSTGRGQSFVRHVLGDMGGADTHDYLSGLDYLVERGIADRKRLGVTGGSYGGFMTSWLITQDPMRFAAAVSLSPATNHVSEHLISNIPHFVSLFLADTYTNVDGKYFHRSPIMHAHKARTPTLNICGALDRCTPPEEALQFHNALLENGVESVLVTYPEEGHGVRSFPAAIDYVARLVGWFEKHLLHGEGLVK